MGLCVSSVAASEIDHEDVFNGDHGNAAKVVGHGSFVGSVCSRTGSKGLNQDSAILYQGYAMDDGILCGVFDGHGKNGHIISKIVRNRLPELLMNQRNALADVKTLATSGSDSDDKSMPSENSRTWSDASISAFKVMDKEVKLQDNLDYSTSGTTAVVVLKQGEELVIANLGDSRAVLGTVAEDGITAVQLTTDLKPGIPSEAERIRKCNGRVLALKEEPHIQRVWLPHDDMPGLAMSRAFGDYLLKNHGIIAVPDISYHRISPEDQFVVLATDGVWDVMRNDEVVSVAWSAMEKGHSAAEEVVNAAAAAWKKKFPSSKVDDCTVVCLFLQSKKHEKDVF